MPGIGIDIGTFHSVAVENNGNSTFPKSSIRSIAFNLDPPIIGIDTTTQMDLLDIGIELIQAPKLLIGRQNGDKDQLLRQAIQGLVYQALQALEKRPKDVVLTIPPGWNLNQCEELSKSVEPLGIDVSFQHEPIALLIAAMHLARFNREDPSIIARLNNADPILVCDWGAGTVDIALVSVSRKDNQHQFACINEITELGHGGTSIARDVIEELNLDLSKNIEAEVYHLQTHWHGDGVKDFSAYDGYDHAVKLRRERAATEIGKKIGKLIKDSRIDKGSNMVCVLHGGPLESDQLRAFLQEQLTQSLGIEDQQFLHIGEKFCAALPEHEPAWRRDVLVAQGAALFASRGEAFPEFEYLVKLKDSFGQPCGSLRLARKYTLRGIQVVTPPFTGVDYFVEIEQARRTFASDLLGRTSQGQGTPIRAELGLYVRPNAVIMYRIREAGPGYSLIEALEAENLPAPVPFEDANIAKVRLPERSTRFSIEL